MKDAATLPLLLKQLRLPTMARIWEDLAREAKAKDWSPVMFLAKLCDYELAERDSRKIQRHMAQSKLPRGKNLESYDFNRVPSVNRAQVIGLGSGDVWIKDGMNLLLFGPSGVGKTHLAVGIGKRLVQAGYRVLFTRTTELLQSLQAAKRDLSLPSALEKLDKFDCLILDDFGYVKKSEMETSLLFELICERYERRSLLITCNQPFKDWDQVFEDHRMAVAAIDRLVHHATLMEVTGESYRKQQATKRVLKEESVT